VKKGTEKSGGLLGSKLGDSRATRGKSEPKKKREILEEGIKNEI